MSATRPMTTPARRPVVIIVLLLLGLIAAWASTPRGYTTVVQVLVVPMAALLALLPQTRGAIATALERVRQPSSRAMTMTALIVASIATAYLLFTAWYQGRAFVPKFHDEHMHLVQMQLLARGKLWLPQHPLADFFETFHVFVKPVYAPIHFYGTSLLYVPTVWLNLPLWLMPVMACGAIVGLVYRIVAELIDGVAGLLAAVLMLSLTQFRYLSIIVMSHTVIILFGLLLVWAYLHWRRDMKLRWALVMGLFAGWAAVTRPVDAIAYAAPAGLAMLFDLRALPLRRWLAPIGLGVLGALPFLLVQVWFNKAVTGDALETPYNHYVTLFHPQSNFGFHTYDPNIRPQTQLAQKVRYYDEFIVPYIKSHQPGALADDWVKNRFPMIVQTTTPHPIVFALLPVGLLGLSCARRWALFGSLPAFLLLYALHPFLLPHYPPIVSPAIVLGVLLGKDVLEKRWPRWRETATVFLTVAIAGFALTATAEVSRFPDEQIPTFAITKINRELDNAVQKPAVVLFRFRPNNIIHQEPVFNFQSAWPDDATVIRAHDLGPEKNLELLKHYAQRQPERHVYFYDRG